MPSLLNQTPTCPSGLNGTFELAIDLSTSADVDREFDWLRDTASGNMFGWTQDAAMGWAADQWGRKEYLIPSTQGGIRTADGAPISLGYHTGHWEVGLFARAASEELTRLGAIPFAGYVSDPCDGRTQGTPGMTDSLAYRNDAAIVLRRLIRSLPTRCGVLGIATCDKGLPAMMALAAQTALPSVVVPGGVTLLPEQGEDAGRVQSLGARFAHGLLSLDQAAELGCRACASPGGGCQFLGTSATAQAVAEALGHAVTHSALAPSGRPIWLTCATLGARVGWNGNAGHHDARHFDPGCIAQRDGHHAAFGGSTNLLLHIPAIAHAARSPRPTMEDWIRIKRQTPRLVDVLPNGPTGYSTVQVFLAGGAPEVMLHLRDLGLLRLNARTVNGCPLGESLAGGPLGRVRDGDTIQITIDRVNLFGRIDLVGERDRRFDADEGAQILAARSPHPDLRRHADLPDDTRLWAAFQKISGGTWGGCVYDVDRIIERLGER